MANGYTVEIDIEEHEQQLIDSLKGGEINMFHVEGIHLAVTLNALKELYRHMFGQVKETLRIAAGITTIKGHSAVTIGEILQAITMQKEGLEKCLPSDVREW